MNDQSSFERLVADQFDRVGPGRAISDMIHDELLSQARQGRQRPRWLALIKEPPMRTSSRLAVGSPAARVVAILVATLLLAVVVAGAGIAGSRLLAADAGSVIEWERVEIPESSGLLDTVGVFITEEQPGSQYRSKDGLDWTELDVAGRVLDAYGDALLMHAPGGVALRHGDGTESVATRPVASGGGISGRGTFRETAFGPAGAVLVDCDAECVTFTVWHSADGEAWAQVYQQKGEWWERVSATADGFVATTSREADSAVLYSTDGVEWTRIDEPGYEDGRELLGTTAWGTVLDSDDSLVLATADGLVDLDVPAEIVALLGNGAPWDFGAGGLGLVGIDIIGARALFSPDGIEWTLEPLPASMPRLLTGRRGGGRPEIHVGPDAVLMSTYVCAGPDGSEVDCEETSDDVGGRKIWYRGTRG